MSFLSEKKLNWPTFRDATRGPMRLWPWRRLDSNLRMKGCESWQVKCKPFHGIFFTRCLRQQSARSHCWRSCSIPTLSLWRMFWCKRLSSISFSSFSLWTSRSTWTLMCQRTARWTQCLSNPTPTSCFKASCSATNAESFTGMVYISLTIDVSKGLV